MKGFLFKWDNLNLTYLKCYVIPDTYRQTGRNQKDTYSEQETFQTQAADQAM